MYVFDSSKPFTYILFLYSKLLLCCVNIGLPKLLGGYHLWQSQDDNCTAPIDLTDKKVVQIRRCEWEIFHIQLM